MIAIFYLKILIFNKKYFYTTHALDLFINFIFYILDTCYNIKELVDNAISFSIDYTNIFSFLHMQFL